MKDLYVLTADADAEAVMKKVLSRHESMGIRQITWEVARHVKHDPGMIKNGPELVQFQKGKFSRVLLLWDHQGSGRENKEIGPQVQNHMAARLDQVTWKGNQLAIAIEPELEAWLWYSPEALQTHFSVTPDELGQWSAEFAKKQGKDVNQVRLEQPKEIFEYLVLKKMQRIPRPNDFEHIAALASLVKWQQNPSFKALVAQLRQWFPMP